MCRKIIVIAALAFIGAVGTAQAQAPQPSPPAAPLPGYGTSISAADAKKAAAAAIAEVGKIGSLPDAIAIVDPGGYLVYFERMQDAHLGSVQFAIDKARSAVLFRRPTKVFERIRRVRCAAFWRRMRPSSAAAAIRPVADAARPVPTRAWSSPPLRRCRRRKTRRENTGMP
jgi:Haem-degrading